MLQEQKHAIYFCVYTLSNQTVNNKIHLNQTVTKSILLLNMKKGVNLWGGENQKPNIQTLRGWAPPSFLKKSEQEGTWIYLLLSALQLNMWHKSKPEAVTLPFQKQNFLKLWRLEELHGNEMSTPWQPLSCANKTTQGHHWQLCYYFSSSGIRILLPLMQMILVCASKKISL